LRSAWSRTARRACCAEAPRRLTHQRALAEQRLDEIDGKGGRAVADIERRVEFDDVERAELPGVGDHFHAQLGLAVGRAARHGGAHAGGNLRVEEVDVETDVQVRPGIESGQRLRNGRPHADLVDVPHVEDVETLLVHEALLARVDAANADLPYAGS
jgi:hypothetical protein